MAIPLFTSIVVAINGSDASIFAAKYAIVLAKNCDCRLTAVYVVDTATIKQLTLSNILIQEENQEYTRSLEIEGDRYLSFMEELAKAKGVAIEKEMRRGEVYAELLSAANERKADLIILGGWERNRRPNDLMSNSCMEIMANTKCSVLLAIEPGIDKIYREA